MSHLFRPQAPVTEVSVPPSSVRVGSKRPFWGGRWGRSAFERHPAAACGARASSPTANPARASSPTANPRAVDRTSSRSIQERSIERAVGRGVARMVHLYLCDWFLTAGDLNCAREQQCRNRHSATNILVQRHMSKHNSKHIDSKQT